MIIFQVWLDKNISKVATRKTKSRQREINKKKKTSKRSVFQNLNFIGSLGKVVDALGILCITLLLYAPKSFKSNFALNPLKLDDFMFSIETLCQMFSKLVLKVLSWKWWLLSQKQLNLLNQMRNWSTCLAQSIEGCKNLFSHQECLLNWSRSGQGPTVTCQALNANS